MWFVRGILGFVLLLDIYWAFWADRRLRRLLHPRLWRTAAALFIIAQAGILLLRAAWPRGVQGADGIVPAGLLIPVILWHLLILPLACICTWIFALCGLVKRLALRIAAAQPELTPGAISRRRLLGAAGVALPMIALGGSVWTGAQKLGEFRIRRMTLRLRGLPADLDGLTIAHVSDLHVGKFLPPHKLPPVVEAVNALHADLVLHTGDLIDYSVSYLPAALEAMTAMKGRWGAAICVGNHDTFDDPYKFVHDTRATGVPLLVNQEHTVRLRLDRSRAQAQVQLLGLPWASGDPAIAASLERTLRLRRDDAFPILLAHHPHAFDPAAAAQLPLTLSGHTHGGQIMFTPTIGAGPIKFRYCSGLYHHGPSQLVVSNGVGNWFPLRIGAPAEIIHLTLTAA